MLQLHNIEIFCIGKLWISNIVHGVTFSEMRSLLKRSSNQRAGDFVVLNHATEESAVCRNGSPFVLLYLSFPFYRVSADLRPVLNIIERCNNRRIGLWRILYVCVRWSSEYFTDTREHRRTPNWHCQCLSLYFPDRCTFINRPARLAPQYHEWYGLYSTHTSIHAEFRCRRRIVE